MLLQCGSSADVKDAVVIAWVAGMGGFALTLADVPKPPGPPQSPIVRAESVGHRQAAPAGDGDQLWQIGSWTDEEQVLLERMNRARMFPLAETGILKALPDALIQYAYTFFQVDFTVMSNHMATLPAQPPLAPNAMLLQAARGHSQWMLANAEQSHFEGTSTVSNRVATVGYPLTIVGENLYAFAEDAEYAHAGLEVDWGYPDATNTPKPPGMQNPPGHRLNTHDARFREAGVGVVYGRNSRVVGGVTETVGPALFTVNLGDRSDATPLITGVAYFDLDGDGRYDAGEGIEGLRVDVSGSGYHGLSSPSGGFAVPTANGSRSVLFSAPGMVSESRTVTVAGGANQKVDLRLVYPAPGVSGSSTPAVGVANPYSPTAVPAATAFRWSVAQRGSVGGAWNAEAGQQRTVVQITPGYDLNDASKKASGAFSYRLTSPEPVDQVLRLDRQFFGGSAPVLSFSILLGYATEYQVIHAEVSEDDGATWRGIWSRAGVTAETDIAFTRVTLPLGSLAFRDFQVRFRYSVGLGPYYNTTVSGEGAFLDDIELSDATALTALSNGEVASGTAVQFTPPAVGEYVIGVQPVVGTRVLPRGPWKTVAAVVGATVLRFGRPSFSGNGELSLPFVVESGSAGSFVLEKADVPAGPWSSASGAVLSTTSPGNHVYRLTPSEGSALYRVRVP